MQDKMYEMTVLLNMRHKCPGLSGTWASESVLIPGKWTHFVAQNIALDV